MGRGHPTHYRKEYDDQARRLCLLGMTDKEMATFFSVTEVTIIAWRKANPSFAAACEEGKTDADARVAESFYKRALGYSHPAVKIFMPQGAEEPVYAPYIEHYPPDTSAAMSWLSNRQRKKWRNKTEVSGPDDGPIVTEVIYRWESKPPEE